MGKLDGKVSFITGIARGQGRSHAIRLAEEGSAIVGIDLCHQIDSVLYPMASPSDLEETVRLVEKAGGRIVVRQGDVRDRSAIEAAVVAGLAEFGRLDIVVANAGIMAMMGPRAKEVQAWYDSIDVMLSGVFHTLQTTIPRIIEGNEGGAIVITSSGAGLKGLNIEFTNEGALGYSAAKHGVVGLMRSYANALAKYRIRVNSVHPGGVASPMIENEYMEPFARENPELVAGLAHALPVSLLDPQDISNAILYLVSDEGRYVSGTTMSVDAGQIAR